jgi:hypothetical protein
MLIKSEDVSTSTLYEIRELYEQHGESCERFLEAKFDVLIMVEGSMIEVYQLPGGEI